MWHGCFVSSVNFTIAYYGVCGADRVRLPGEMWRRMIILCDTTIDQTTSECELASFIINSALYELFPSSASVICLCRDDTLARALILQGIQLR